MPTFRTRALTATGATVTGQVEAPSEAAAIQHLRDLGHYPISARAVAGRWHDTLKSLLLRPRTAGLRDLSVATQELATLLHAGLPLDRALDILTGLRETERLQAPLTAVLARVRDGSRLSDALAAERVFPPLYVGMVRAGELGSALELTLRRLGDYLARAHAIRQAVASALVYPALLLATACMSITVILVFVLPQFEPLFRGAGKSPPLVTEIALAAGDFLGSYGWAIALLILAAAIGFRHALTKPQHRHRWHALLLHLPVLGDLIARMEMERFSRTLAALLTSGVPLPTALGMTKDTLTNSIVAGAVAETATRLREGDTLADRLERTGAFLPVTLDFVRVGEDTGKLHEMLARHADLCERTIKHSIERLLAMLVPALTIGLGVIVGGLIASMLVAVLSINDLAV